MPLQQALLCRTLRSVLWQRCYRHLHSEQLQLHMCIAPT